MAEREKPLLREIAIGELTAKEHPRDGSDGERVEDPALLVVGEIQVLVADIKTQKRQPGAVNHQLQEHHHG